MELVAGVVVGGKVPVVNSRSDDVTYLYLLALKLL